MFTVLSPVSRQASQSVSSNTVREAAYTSGSWRFTQAILQGNHSADTLPWPT